MEIVFQRVSKKYRSKMALQDFTTTLCPGIYGLLGANGAGKTTLINILVGVLPRTSGKILIDGQEVQNLKRNFLRQVGYLPQYPKFYRDFTIFDFLDYMCALKEIPVAEGRQRIKDLLEAVNLQDFSKTKIGALSGGMRQRVGIVQAMLGDPKLLIFDEPTAGLDPQERIRFRNLISRFSEGRIVILATHIVSDVDAIANQVLILKQGKLIRQNSPDALTRELDGKVWEVVLQNDQELENFDCFPISNMQREGSKIKLRILFPEKPSKEAQAVTASLEDVFLYHFGENRQETHPGIKR